MKADQEIVASICILLFGQLLNVKLNNIIIRHLGTVNLLRNLLIIDISSVKDFRTLFSFENQILCVVNTPIDANYILSTKRIMVLP